MHCATARPRRALSLLLALVLLLGLVPGLPGGETASAHWADPYLSQLLEWGFIRADQTGNPDKALTRADFMSIVNRAYGYHEVGVTPFEDVGERDWFYDDVGIAYNARYIHGTSPTTASPNDTLTRETAATILGRNMMLQESTGEILDFSDAREISNWSRGTIKSSLEHYLVSGYDDGTFRPQKNVTWGEMAALISRTVGTPLQEAGDYSLGGVFGNVTVTSPGVTLRDTVISGDLYITGGVGQGNIKLENVTVLGRIIASGSGESEGGEASILLRNVTADELLVDNLQDNYVTVRADGVTDIGHTTVRTSAYIEDNTPDGMGLKYISLEGETYPEGEEPEDWEPIQLDLAGRIEEVVNRTPNSQVKAAKGTVAKLTVDEAAVGSTVVIDRGAVVKELNLDTGTTVTGEGDIEKLVVNAPGSDVAMLPDQIVIRPGITATINGVEMDSVAAEESSMDPLILSGYPQATDITPTSVKALFSTNKRGTIYWAVSAITDGSVGEDELIKPPSYGGIALRSGNILSPKGNEEVTASIAGLTPDGSYYLSAVLVDDRGQRSPTKVIAFTTPDNTVPAFAQGYPHMSKVSRRDSVAVVMPTKDCKLYYVLLPRAAQAPTVNELKAGAVSGALGYGVQDVYKNVESTFRINDRVLEEQTDYTVYFWLTDANGANSSAIVPLPFTTADETPPTFVMGPLAGKGADTSVPISFRLSEDGTVFWAVVPEGEPYPRAANGQTGTAPLDSTEAKLQVASGQGALSSGSVSASAAKDGNFNITGLEPEKAYDLYYVAKDKAGNYSLTVGKMTISTADSTGPVVKLLSKNIRVGDPIVFEFSENVKPDANGPVTQDLLALYKATLTASDKEQAKKNLRDALTYCIELYEHTQGTGQGNQLCKSRPYPWDASEDWVIDFSQAVVASANDSSGKITVTIPGSAHQLKSAGTYHFKVQNLTDNAGNRLPDKGWVDYTTDPKWGHEMPIFTVVFAEIYLAQFPQPDEEELPVITTGEGESATTEVIQPDVFFRMIPWSTHSAVDGRTYDLLMFTNKTMRFELYYRVVDTAGKTYPTTDAEYVKDMPGAASGEHLGDYGWVKLGGDSGLITNGNKDGEPKVAVSLQAQFNDPNASPELNHLNDSRKVYYEFAIRVLQINGDDIDKRETWGDDLEMEIYAAAATPTSMRNLTISHNAITEAKWAEYQSNGLAASNGAVDVGTTDTEDSFLTLEIPFPSTGNPKFNTGSPKLTPGDTFVKMELTPDVACRIHYVIAPVGSITTTVSTGDKEDGSGAFKNQELLEKNNPPKPEDPDDPDSAEVRGPYKGPYVPDSAAAGDPNAEHAEDKPDGWVRSPNKLSIWYAKYKDPNIKISSAPDPEDPTKTVPYLPYAGDDYAWTEIVKDLEPETDYFAYFVLESLTTERPSSVYLYTFTTGEIKNPKISLERPGGGLVTAKTDKNSVLRWTMYSTQALMGIPMMSWKLSDHLADGYTVADLGGKDYTLLEAMCEPTGMVEYSVFDLYADNSVKQEIFGLIAGGTSTSGTTSLNGGTINTNLEAGMEYTSDTIDSRYKPGTKNEPLMLPESQYIFLAMACHENGNQKNYLEHSFRAVDNVFVPDPDVPRVTSLSTSITNYTNNGYSGAVIIGFSKPLYWTEDGATAWGIHATSPTAPKGTVAADGDNYKELLRYIGGTAKDYFYFDPGDQQTAAVTEYTIRFKDMPSNVKLTLFNRGDLANASATRVPGAKLEATFTGYPNRADEEVSGFKGTFGGKTVENIGLSTIPLSSSGGGDIDITFPPRLNDHFDKATNTIRLKVGDVEPINAVLDIIPAEKITFWKSDNEAVASVAKQATPNTGADESANITASKVGMATITITVRSDRPEAYQSVTVIVEDDKLDVNVPQTPSTNTEKITYDPATKTIEWKRKDGTRPSETLTLVSGTGMADLGSNVTVDWSSGGSVVKVTKINNTSAQIGVVQSGTEQIVITVKAGNTTIQTMTINVLVKGNDSGQQTARPAPSFRQ